MARPNIDIAKLEFDGWDQLDALIVWANQAYCAEKLGISVDTLARRIKEKFNCGFADYKHKRTEPMRVNLLKKQYDVAMNGNVSMLIWLGKQHLGQKDKHETETKGTVQINIDKDDAKL